MNIKIGDRVKFINDVGGGIVTAYLDEKTIEVQDEDGFEIPILATEVLLESEEGFGWDGQNKPRNEIKHENSLQQEAKVKPGDFSFKKFDGEILLAIVPENDKLLHVSDLKLYLINDSNYSIQYIISQVDSKINEFVKQGILEPETKLEIKKYNQSTLSKIKQINLQGIMFKEGLFELQKQVNKTFNLENLSFYKASTFKENDYFDNNAYLNDFAEFNLEDAVNKLNSNELMNVSLQKEKLNENHDRASLPAKKKATDIEEVDLHIESIIDDHENLSKGEIVEIQLNRFETALETVRKSNQKKVVFIHGVGNGRLKHELRKKLDRKYPELRYQDASFKEYGYGATLVYL
jgi:hypothetical protein